MLLRILYVKLHVLEHNLPDVTCIKPRPVMTFSFSFHSLKIFIVILFICGVSLQLYFNGSTIIQLFYNKGSGKIVLELKIDKKHNRYCEVHYNKAGAIHIPFRNLSLEQVEQELSAYEINRGSWQPLGCIPRSRTAVIVAYRDRYSHLALFLLHMHPFLQRQKIQYTIFVVEQSAKHEFNRGAVFNAGFMEVIQRRSYDCYILHDVDMLPEDDRITYNCTDNPRHLAAALDKWNYKLLYQGYTGGIVSVTRQQFEAVNGFSNIYFGWGGEDDDFGYRLRERYKINRYPMEISRYKTLSHRAQKPSEDRFKYLEDWKNRYRKDGLTNVQYELQLYEEKKLFTHIKVEVRNTNYYKQYNMSKSMTQKTMPKSITSKLQNV